MSRSRRFRSRADLSRNDTPLSHRDRLRSPPPGLRHDLPIPDARSTSESDTDNVTVLRVSPSSTGRSFVDPLRCMHIRCLIQITDAIAYGSTQFRVRQGNGCSTLDGCNHALPRWHVRRIVMRPPRSERREHPHLIELEELVDPPARRHVGDGRAQPARRGDSRCKARYHLAR